MRDLPSQESDTKTDSSNGAAAAGPVFLPGTRVDVLDTVGKWMQAIIAEVDGQAALIHYCSWTCQWDEVLPMNSPRIAPLGTHTCTLGSLGVCSLALCDISRCLLIFFAFAKAQHVYIYFDLLFCWIICFEFACMAASREPRVVCWRIGPLRFCLFTY